MFHSRDVMGSMLLLLFLLYFTTIQPFHSTLVAVAHEIEILCDLTRKYSN